MTSAENAINRGKLKDDLKAFGFFPFLLVGVGGFSVIDLLERVFAYNFDLITPFAVLLENYHRLTELLGVAVEPPVRWLFAQLDWEINLRPIWRSATMFFTALGLPAVLRFRPNVRWPRRTIWILYYALLCIILGIAMGISLPQGYTHDATDDRIIVVIFMIGLTLGGLYLVSFAPYFPPSEEYDRTAVRHVGLAMMGGTIAAGLIVLSDWIVKLLT
jgi:hypothetical protein